MTERIIDLKLNEYKKTPPLVDCNPNFERGLPSTNKQKRPKLS
jgi:hypothetical protein